MLSILLLYNPGLVPLLLSSWFMSRLIFYSINVVQLGKALDIAKALVVRTSTDDET
jgi:hypothetical protein